MEACQSISNVSLGGCGEIGFIFPKLHPGFDAMFSIAKVLEMLTIQERSLAQIRTELPRVAHKSLTVRCPWKIKGALMRYLLETHDSDRLELIDGVKIITPQNDNWVLILPDADESMVHIFANGDDPAWVDRALKDYRQRVKAFITEEQGDSMTE
jgi:mannose-1-phosphate guanylyltransferase/phosphomannomutase